MIRLSDVSQIWPPSTVEETDLEEAIGYATISLPWTFDRMRYGKRGLITQNGVNFRLIHILIGVLNQTILERELKKRTIPCKKDWTNYRESDVFDFNLANKIFDVKTYHIFSEYNERQKREQFSPELLINNKDYSGPLWRIFLPMMVTISQLTIDKLKDAYIFGITETKYDIRRIKPKLGDNGFWCTAPCGKSFNFFQNTRLISAREEKDIGFKINVKWKRTYARINGTKRNISITLFGEWDSKPVIEKIDVKEGKDIQSKKEFASLSCIRLEHPAILDENDKIEITVENFFNQHVSKISNPKENLNDPDFIWSVNKDSFVNLKVPDDYKIYWVGFIPYKEFIGKFIEYPSYFIPKGDMDKNQLGKINSNLLERFEAFDRRRQKALDEGKSVDWPKFTSCIKGSNINAGILLVAMRGPRPIGAACYYYPPYAMQETAIYVLPKDIYIMDELKNFIS